MNTACHCGHPYPAEPTIIGYMAGDESALALANCGGCKTTYTARIIDGAAVCYRCMGLIMGRSEDPKCCIVVGDEPPLVLCRQCAKTVCGVLVGRRYPVTISS